MGNNAIKPHNDDWYCPAIGNKRNHLSKRAAQTMREASMEFGCQADAVSDAVPSATTEATSKGNDHEIGNGEEDPPFPSHLLSASA